MPVERDAACGVVDRRLTGWREARPVIQQQRHRARDVVETGGEIDLDVGGRRPRPVHREVRLHRHARPVRIEDRQHVRRDRLPRHVVVVEEQTDEIAEVDEVLVRAVRAEDGEEHLLDRYVIQEAALVEVTERRAGLDRAVRLRAAEGPGRAVEVRRRRRAVEERGLVSTRKIVTKRPSMPFPVVRSVCASCISDDSGRGGGERCVGELRVRQLRVRPAACVPAAYSPAACWRAGGCRPAPRVAPAESTTDIRRPGRSLAESARCAG